MNTRLLQTFEKIVKPFKTQWHIASLMLLSIMTVQTHAQCIGPYQTFESFKTLPATWTFTSFASSANANARTGANLLQSSTAGATAVTPTITNAKTVAFYVNKSASVGVQLAIDLQFSSDGGTNWYSIPTGTNTVNGEDITATIPTLPTTAGLGTWTLVTATFNTNHQLDVIPTNSSFKFRIRDARASGSGALWVDDFSIMTYNTSPDDNAIVVPMLNQASACTVTVPASGYMNFYDQGGLNDNHNKSQTQYIYFQPTNATDKIRITFQNTFALDASSNITVYNGNGTGGTVLLNAYTSTTSLPGTTVYTSSSSDGNISIKFVSSTNTPLAGFDIKVECVGNLAITSLGSTSGCPGSQLVINGSGFSGTTAGNVTIGGVAVSSIVSNTGTVLTVIPATGSSGTVSVTNGSTVTYGTYTVNAVPVITSVTMGSQTVCSGVSAAALSISATAGSGTISTYQWYSNTTASNSGGTSISGANAASYTPLTSVVGTLYYYCVVTNSNGCSATSAVSGAVTVTSPPTTSTNGGNISSCKGTTTAALGGNTPSAGTGTWTCTAAPVGGSTSDITFTSASTGNTTAIVSSTATAGAYTLTWTIASAGCTSSSSSLTLTVNAAPSVTSGAMGGQTVCQNATATALSINATAGSGTISSYQWFSNTIASNSGGTSISGANAASYTPSTATAGTLYYYCLVTNSNGCSTTSVVSGAIVVTSTSISTPAASAATSIGGTSFTANWGSVAGATGYYLDVSTSNTFATFVTGYNNLSVGNVTSYSVTGLTQNVTYYYRVRAYNTCATSSNSSTISLTTVSISYCSIAAPSTTTTSVNSFSTSGGITNISNLNTGFTAGGYANYTSQSCSQYPGSNVNYSISSLRTDSTDQTFFYYIWIDWNNNGSFNDAGETIVATTTYQSSPFTGVISVSSTQAAGSYRMRVSTSWVGANTSCSINSGGRGEVEDYTFTVVPVPPCAPSTPSVLTTLTITATTAVISWTDAAMTPNSVYDYYYNTSGTAPLTGTTPSGTVTGALNATLTGLTLGQTYYFWVRSNCGTPNPWVGSANFTTVNQDVVIMTNGNITSCNVLFYDSGGSGSNYSNSENYTYTFYPATSGNKLKVVFSSFNTENNWDGLVIYNGNSTSAPMISSGLNAGTGSATNCPAGSYYGTVSPGTIYSTASDGSLTFQFRSDGSVTSSGWSATVTCVTVPRIDSFTPSSVCSGNTPTVTITGANFTGVTSVKFNGVSAAFTFNSDSSITATLPASATTGYITITTISALNNNTAATGTSSTLFYVNPIPTAPSAGSNVAICNGSSTVLNGSSTATNTVTVLSENFDATSWPSTWSRTLNGGYSPGDFRTSSEFVSAGNTWPGNGRTGYCSYFYSYLISSGTSGDMITPTMDLSTYSSASLTFWIYNSSGSDVLKVYANNNGGAYSQIGSTYSTYGSWTQITISLNSYVGSGFTSVRIKFTGTSDFGLSNIGIDDVAITGSNTSTYVWSPSTGLSSTTILNPTASPTTTTTYTLTTSFATGCSASSSVTVTVRPQPTGVISVSGATSVCSGNTSTVSIALTGTAPWNLTYSNGSTSTTVTGIATSPYTFTTPAITSATTYTLTALSDATCSASAGGMTGSAVISISAAPTITIASSAASVCYSSTSQTTTLAYTATTGTIATYSVVWNTPSGISGTPNVQTVNNATFTGSSPISITVPAYPDNTVVPNQATLTVTNTNGCVSAGYPFSITINTSPTVSAINAQTICYDASNPQTVNFSYSGASTSNMYDLTWNTTPTNSLPNISNAPFTATSGTISVTVPAGTAGGTYTGTLTPKNASCGNGATPRTVTLIVSAPSITPTASPIQVCYSASSQTANLTYSNATATPTTYSIVWSTTPTNSFANVTNATISASPIVLSIPAGTAVNTYTGTITVKNANGCTSPSSSFSVNVNAAPTMTASSTIKGVCSSASAQTAGLNYTATTYNPNSYSIAWNAAAISAGFTNQGATVFTFNSGGGTVNTIAVPANIAVGSYSGTITITNAGSCASSYPFSIEIGKKWVGTVSSDWTNASNWTPSGEPSSSDYCVVIPSGTPNNPVIASNANCGNLTINTGATLTVNAGYTLTVQDYVKTDGTLTVNNGGSLVQVNNVSNSGTGSMVYKRDVSGLHGYDYVYWSSPVASQNIASIYSTPTPGGMYYWDVLANNGNGTGGNTSQGNWANASGAMQVGKGYIVRASSSYSWTGTLTSTFTGIPNNGTLTYPLYRGAYTGGTYTGVNGSIIGQWDDNYNLIGNPYPSAIDAVSFLNDAANSSRIQGYVYLWTHGSVPSSSVNNPFYGSYSVNYNLSDYLVYNSLGTSTPTGFNGKIASGQGFYVALNDGATVTDTSQPITFKNSMRSASYNNTQFYKNSNTTTVATDSELHRIWIDFIDSNHSSTSTLIGYATNATNGVDRMYDAATGIDGNVLYSVIDNQTYSIQGRSVPFDAEDKVALGYHSATLGNFTIAINSVDGLFQQGQPIYLEDKLLNVIYDLRQAPYNFSTTEGIYNDRFVLRFTNSALSTHQIGNSNVAISVNNNQLMVKANKEIESVQVFDLTGKLIRVYNESIKTTDFKEEFVFEKGVYLAKIQLTDGTLISQKIMN